MTIIFDSIIFSLQKVGGISTYWYELISRFIYTNNLVLFIEENDNNNIEHDKIKSHKYIIYKKFIRFLTLYRFSNIRAKSLNKNFIFHSSYYRICSNPYAFNIVTVHDFIHEKYYTGFRKLIHNFQKSYAIKQANLIITVSESTKKDLLFYHPKIDENKIKVIYNGVSNDFYKLNEQDEELSNSFLYIGSREHYKNFITSIDLISKFNNFNLIIVGNTLSKYELNYLNLKLYNRWKLYTKISNKDLNKLYNSAFALIYLSSYEGFGIPLLEAMKAGCPFLALNNSSIPEVAGNAGILLNNLTISSFNDAINILINNRSEIINKGYIQASKFSWDKCFNETIDIYKSLLI